MVSKKEFLEKYGKEGLCFEAKSAPNGIPHDFWETYSAFANTFGGTVVFGISEDESRNLVVTGVEDPENTVKILWDNLNNPRIVSLNLLSGNDIRIETVEDVKVITIDIPPATRTARPIYIRNNLNSGTFKRNYEGDYHCRMEEIKQMVRDSSVTTTDTEPIEEYMTECFDYGTIERFLREMTVRHPGHPWSKVPTEEFLLISNSARMGKDGLRPTIAGLLMFGKGYCIRNCIPNYFLDYMEVPENEGWNNRWDFRIHTSSGEFSGNIYDFISMVINRLSTKINGPFSIDGPASAGSTERFISVREAVINAVFHADYLLGSPVTIRLFGNKLEVSNPGTMRVRIEDAKAGGRSDPRNGALMTLVQALGWVERAGTGIHTIEQAVGSGCIGYADFSEHTDPSSVRVVIGLDPPRSSGSPVERRILEALVSDPQLTIRQMSVRLNVSASTVANAVARLKAEGRLAREGSNKTGRWIVK